MRFLVEAKASLYGTDDRGATVFYCAAEWGYTQILATLVALRRGSGELEAEPRRGELGWALSQPTSDGCLPLMRAALNGKARSEITIGKE